jgi:hypothetical protein
MDQAHAIRPSRAKSAFHFGVAIVQGPYHGPVTRAGCSRLPRPAADRCAAVGEQAVRASPRGARVIPVPDQPRAGGAPDRVDRGGSPDSLKHPARACSCERLELIHRRGIVRPGRKPRLTTRDPRGGARMACSTASLVKLSSAASKARRPASRPRPRARVIDSRPLRMQRN